MATMPYTGHTGSIQVAHMSYSYRSHTGHNAGHTLVKHIRQVTHSHRSHTSHIGRSSDHTDIRPAGAGCMMVGQMGQPRNTNN